MFILKWPVAVDAGENIQAKEKMLQNLCQNNYCACALS